MWLPEWIGNASHIKVIPPLKCKSPESLKDKPIKKLGMQELGCVQPTAVEKVPDNEKHVEMELHPSLDQVVFEGDSLMLMCQVWMAGKPKVWWTWDTNEDSSHHDIYFETRAIPEKGQVDWSVLPSLLLDEESKMINFLNIESLLKEHAGRYECHAESELKNLSSSISILVISNSTRYCPETMTYTNKGNYLWPQTIVKTTVELPCAGEANALESGTGSKSKFPLPMAFHYCAEEGIWEGLNTSACMNLSLTNSEVLESAQRLLNFTADGKNLQDMMDIVFISKTVENYLSFVSKEKELGPVLVDLVGVTSKLPPSLLVSAQLEDGACNRLVGAVEYVAASYSHSLSKPEMAVEEFKIIEASIQVPATLFHQLEAQGYQLPNPPHKLMVSAFENSRLFPRILPNSMKHGDGKEVASCVVGSKLIGIDVRNLTDPVYVMIRAPVEIAADEDVDDIHSVSGKGTKGSWLVRWDQDMNNGLGGWSEDGCHLSHFHMVDSLLVFHCDSLGHFGLLRDIPLQPGKSRRWTGNTFHFSHPAVYAGSFIGFFSMLVTISTYVIFHASIHMSRKAKHSLVNTWIAMSLLLMMFSLGIRQTGHFRLCQGIGLVLHYLILSSLLWMVVTLSNMYKKLTKSDNLDGAHDDEPPPDHPPKKPMLGFYLVGWGIALIICGISGAVNMKNYAGRHYCFLAPNPSISAIYVPAAGILFLILVFSLLIHCVASSNISEANGRFSAGTRVTENIDLELEETSRIGENSVGPPVASVGPANGITLRRIEEENEENDEDMEHSPHAQLGSHMALLLLFLLMWATAALTTVPFQSPAILHVHGEAVFGVFYGVFSSALGIFILVFYCVLRCDVRSCWEACWSRGDILVGPGSRGRGSRCCRSRSISDVGAVKPVGNIDCMGKQNGIVAVPQGPKHAVSMSSAVAPVYQPQEGTTRTHQHSGTDDSTKSLHLPVTMPGPQLPPPPAPFPPQGVAALDSSTSGPDISMFYNPHQMGVARKFFRRQRQMRHGRRGVSGSDTASPPSVARRRRAVASGNSDAERGISNASNKRSSPIKEKDANTSARSSPIRPPLMTAEKPSTSKVDEEAEGEIPVERFVIGAEDDEKPSAPIKMIEDDKTDTGVSTIEVRMCGNGEESCSSPVGCSSLRGREVPGAVAGNDTCQNPGNIIKQGHGSQCNSLCNFDVGDAPTECTSSDSGCKTENRDEEVKHSSDSPTAERTHLAYYSCSGGEGKEDDRLHVMPIRGSSDSEVEVPCFQNGKRVFDVSGDFTSLGRTRKKNFMADYNADHPRCRSDFMYITSDYVDVPRVSITEKSELLPDTKLSEGNSELDSYNSDEEILLEDNSSVMKKETSV
ncbi:hypothetical protein J437_LFUL017567 [Ladona fulva]|uniref:Uncharacterized protein n=1 Tax=Ladona fulva TaxID=123851 RepID=A0A8K0P8X7_LADFU|nr:hypothetical protein J437_LFUL017567 [Ladona fulva]